jgi:hypothetical protein
MDNELWPEVIDVVPREVPTLYGRALNSAGSEMQAGVVEPSLFFGSASAIPVGFDVISLEAITMWLQIPELYGSIGNGAGRSSGVAAPGASFEQLKVMPRVVPTAVIQAEESLRYERLTGTIGP